MSEAMNYSRRFAIVPFLCYWLHRPMNTYRRSSLGWAALLVAALLASGCRGTYYAAYEKFGVYKRDLLKKRVVEARDGQKETQEQFKDALTRLKEITKFEGGELENRYTSLKSEYDDCESKAESVRKRIRAVETVAGDLFEEWAKEIGQIGTPTLRESSRQQLEATRQRYEDLHRALKSAEQSMTPVLSQFRDYVLFLKHNLNAQAIASLKGETTNIQDEISRLIEQMNRSIARADEFVRTLK
jgi:chromosome segregation ATPase